MTPAGRRSSTSPEETEASAPTRLRIGGRTPLRPVDPARAERWRADLAAAAGEAGCPRLAALLARESDVDADRIAAVLDLSPHLNALMLRRPDWLEQLFDIDAGDRVRAIVDGLAGLPEEAGTEAGLMTRLRQAKAEASLLVALRDLFGAADGRRITADLSDIAEGAVRAALRFGLLDLSRRGKLVLPRPERPEIGCGLFVLGMGKLGGRELNYSSDIDLIVLFDPACAAIVEPEESVDLFSKLVRRLVRIIGERTGDGYVFRTDLRLRPDPGAMPLAIPVPAAIGYYEMSGRNWERAAMIKARFVAGDEAASAAFLDEMTPFVWRKYLDFATIAEIQSMKDRIDRHRGFEGIGVAGHNVKLGPGGIREVEFFVQTQQLIAGGRSPFLRLRRTEETLEALVAGGWISAEAALELTEAYWFLRRVEHAVQMVADEQTHVLPEDEPGLLVIARLLGFNSVADFSAALVARLERVEARFSGLYASDRRGEDGDAAARDAGLLLEGEDEAAAVERLAQLGFARPADVARLLHRWGEGRYRATRAEATRLHMGHVLPSLLRALAAASDPDAALVAFDRFLERLPAGLQFFSLIASNPKILDLLTLILTAAPRLSEIILKRPHVFDALLDPAFYNEMPTRQLLTDRLSAFLGDADDYEDALVRLRIFAAEQGFLIGARLLSGAIEGEAAGLAFSNLADVVLTSVFQRVEAAFVERHGQVPGGRMAILGLGRLGSRELTAGSDVDLILLYDHAQGTEESDGEKPLAIPLYYGRLTQRLIAALTAPMGEGVLYEVDFRLRPSGNKGPLATHLDAFRRYQEAEAWTWEHMALTRARTICGNAALRDEIETTIRAIVATKRDQGELAHEVASMRARIEREKPSRGALDLKLRPGGLIDLEFIAQWSVLAGHVPPDMIGRPTMEILATLEARGLRDLHPTVSLHSCVKDFTRVIQLTRLGPKAVRGLDEVPKGLGERLARALDLAEPEAIEASVGEMAASVREAFAALLPLKPDGRDEKSVRRPDFEESRR